MRAQLDWGCFVIVAGMALLAALLYPSMPEIVPIHFGADGRPDGYGPRTLIAFMPLCFLGFMAILMAALPFFAATSGAASPRVLAWIGRSLLLVVAGIHLSMILVAMGRVSVPPTFGLSGLGILFVVLGNFMGKLRRNTFIGIRTSWTLADDDVWYRTHRLGGKVMLAGGVVVIVIGLLPIPLDWTVGSIVATVLLAALVPAVYSYRIRKRDDDPQDGTDIAKL